MKKRLVIKIGSNVLTKEDGSLHIKRLYHLAEELSQLKEADFDIILVSSGAMAAGKSILPEITKSDSISKRQIWASMGQVQLIQSYSNALAIHDEKCAQVLVTKEDFKDRTHYLTMRSCFEALLEQQVIPIVNENDVVSVTELMFTDNDELAGLVASMVDATELLILTNVDGIFDGSPNSNESSVIPVIANEVKTVEGLQIDEASQFGRGGIITKFSMAKKTASLGIPVRIMNGCNKNVLTNWLSNLNLGTYFEATKQVSKTKKWLAHSTESTVGYVTIDDGAFSALIKPSPTSLLPVGVLSIEGEFEKGDLIKVKHKNQEIGIGKAAYSSKDLVPIIGKSNQKALIHYDYLYLITA